MNDFTISEPIYFLEQIFIPDEIALNLHDKLNKLSNLTCVMVAAQRVGYRDLHIINKSATKEHAIAELLNILDVDKDNTIGLGDGHNDIQLFNAVSHRVAMGNAVPELKDMADEIIEDVKYDGMAKYFKRLIANNKIS